MQLEMLHGNQQEEQGEGPARGTDEEHQGRQDGSGEGDQELRELLGGLLGDQQVRYGDFYYAARTDDSPNRFAILFDRMVVDGRARPMQTWFIFDGNWLLERDHEDKTAVRRELVAEGQGSLAGGDADPLRQADRPRRDARGRAGDDRYRVAAAGEMDAARSPNVEPLERAELREPLGAAPVWPAPAKRQPR